MNILFVCSRNQWRSRTAEDIFKTYPSIQVKSAGTSNSARIKVTGKMLDWADFIFVMEKKHKEFLCQKFPLIVSKKELIILDIQDEYAYMDQELVDELKLSLSSYVDIS